MGRGELGYFHQILGKVMMIDIDSNVLVLPFKLQGLFCLKANLFRES